MFTREGSQDAGGGIQMETRSCKCGCGTKWRCMVSSKQEYASTACEASVTPGGMSEVMKTKRRQSMKELPESASGIVGSQELAKKLGVAIASIYNWQKAGKITPIDPNKKRNIEWDLADVRRQLLGAAPAARVSTNSVQTPAGISTTVTYAPIAKQSQMVAKPVAKEPEEQEEDVAGDDQVEGAGPLETAIAAAVEAYLQTLRDTAKEAKEQGNAKVELEALRYFVNVDVERLEAAIGKAVR
jgi:hypothetical protein